MARHMGTWPGISVAIAALMVGTPESVSWAVEFSEAQVFAELNDTDGDLGFHALIDGDAWKRLEIEDPEGRQILLVRPARSLGQQGLTELFFESAEPTFDDLSPEEFFERFPEGDYRISGRTIDGKTLKGSAEFTHVMPAAPVIEVNRNPVPEDCDARPVPALSEPFKISWDPVTESHPEIGRPGEVIDVLGYEVVVEREDPALKFSIELPPDVTKVKLPRGLAIPGDQFKVEVLVKEASGNQTATESCFEVE